MPALTSLLLLLEALRYLLTNCDVCHLLLFISFFPGASQVQSFELKNVLFHSALPRSGEGYASTFYLDRYGKLIMKKQVV